MSLFINLPSIGRAVIEKPSFSIPYSDVKNVYKFFDRFEIPDWRMTVFNIDKGIEDFESECDGNAMSAVFRTATISLRFPSVAVVARDATAVKSARGKTGRPATRRSV